MVAQREPETAYRPMIRDMPQDERPRERMRLRGPGGLSNAELLAILLRTGSAGENVVDLAGRLLRENGGLEGLTKVSFTAFCNVRNVGEAKAAQVLAALELGRRVVSSQPDQRTTVRSPEDVFALVGADMALYEQEHLVVILLNARYQVLGVREVYKGNVHSAIVRVAEVFRDAVRDNCPSILVVHNHPSGDPTPSPEDANLTRQLHDAGRLLNIELVDHIIISRKGPYSLKNAGIGFPA